ncbi:sugar phosphate isomerase/epimerase family protein [Tautonia sociabilis]|uniref:Sugar phosphate isomerase/epimerase n=1 Tax=Tautonia sociabilis TaxID=2080755 RepID=A0A432MKN9_9BACT|nr:sugar phosphate isomerase/epimerase [Tautonia sociabilis]RUL87706.1 sugar phosphate isomerase/epimerase [Tautonia sociabilis]
MRIGLDLYTIGHLGLSPFEALDFASSNRLNGVQFLEPSAIAPDLDPDRLRDVRRRADRLGLYVEVGLPSPNPFGGMSPPGAPIDPEERASWFRPHLEAVAALGATHARAVVGNRHDRFRIDVPWARQLEATSRTLLALRPLLRDLGLRIAIETHADLTCDEVLALVDAVGDDVLGVTLDTGNLPMRLDDPIEAADRLSPLVLMTHTKDAALAFSPRGLLWQARPVGSGVIPVAEILELLRRRRPGLNLSIELHPRTYDLPIFDPSWLASFPELRPSSLAAVVRLAVEGERRIVRGRMPGLAEVEQVPWPDRAADWIARSVAFLRSVVGRGGG